MRKLTAFLSLLVMILLPISMASAAQENNDQHSGIEITVNINTAMADEIATMLQGVGEKKAQDIVEYREQHGKFADLESLKQVKGIGQATIDKNKDRIVL